MLNNYSTAQLVWFGVMAVQLLAIIVTTIRAFSLGKKKTSVLDAVETVELLCASCGWQGEVPVLRKRCPMCGDNNFAAPQ